MTFFFDNCPAIFEYIQYSATDYGPESVLMSWISVSTGMVVFMRDLFYVENAHCDPDIRFIMTGILEPSEIYKMSLDPTTRGSDWPSDYSRSFAQKQCPNPPPCSFYVLKL